MDRTKALLPKTGENRYSSIVLMIFGFASIMVALIVILKKEKKNR
ncbi:LPXTG cell wall anchor domain-containing protein [Lactococcus taiwanensis]